MEKRFLFIILAFALVLICFIGCEPDYPPSIYDPNDEGGPTPVITSINPPDSTYGLIAPTKIVEITGQHFSDVIEYNLVYFGSELGTVLDAAESQLTVEPPANFQDSLTIKVASRGAYLFGYYGTEDNPHPYKLKNAISKPGGYLAEDNAGGICVDANENLYVARTKSSTLIEIDKVTPSGVREKFGELRKQTNNIKIGPEGAFYYVYTKFFFKTTIDSAGNATHKNKRLSGNLYGLDFDSNKNLYAVGADAIYTIDPSTLSNSKLGEYEDTTFTVARIYNDELYTVGSYVGYDTTVSTSTFLWKIPLDITTGTFAGDMEIVLDWSTTAYPLATITSLAFNQNGKMYISTKSNSLLSIEPVAGSYSTGIVEQVYPRLLGSESVFRMIWGEGDYLYINSQNDADPDKNSILKVNMFELSAPYNGRN